MSHHQGEAIAQAIREEPADHVQRLVYADWLEEFGETDLDAARAALIRVQIARESADPGTFEYWDLRARERLLITRFGDDLSSAIRTTVEDLRFRGGFIEAVALPTDRLAGAALRSLEPVRALALTGRAEALTPDLLRPYDWLRVWNVRWGVARPERQRELADAVRLHRLDVNAGWLEFTHRILEQGQPLEHLGLGSMQQSEGGQLLGVIRFTPTEIDRLVELPRLRTLRSLDMRGVGIETQAWTRLLAAPETQHLEQLYLWADEDDGNVLRTLSDEPNLTGLHSLWLGGNPPPMWLEGDPARMRYTPGPGLRGLRKLVIQGFVGFEPGNAELLTALQMTELETLRVEYPAWPGELVRLLETDDPWPKLRTLELHRGNHPRAGELLRLLASPCVSRLRRLMVPHVPLNSLPERGSLPLTELTITATDRPTSLAAIANLTSLPNLTALEIANVVIDDPGDLTRLMDPGRFPHLQRIHLGGIPLDAAVQQRYGYRLAASAQPVTAFTVHDRVLEG